MAENPLDSGFDKFNIPDISEVVFDNLTVTYNGSEHELVATNIPEGVDVEYTNNKRTNAGTQQASAVFSYTYLENAEEDPENPWDPETNPEPEPTEVTDIIDTLTADLLINKAEINTTGIEFADLSVVYDGAPKSLAITGSLPTGVTVAYTGNAQTEVGEHTVIATLSGSNYNNHTLQATLTITPMAEEPIPEPDNSDLPEEYAGQILSIIAEENNFNYLRVGGLLADDSEPLNTATFVASWKHTYLKKLCSMQIIIN